MPRRSHAPSRSAARPVRQLGRRGGFAHEDSRCLASLAPADLPSSRRLYGCAPTMPDDAGGPCVRAGMTDRPSTRPARARCPLDPDAEKRARGGEALRRTLWRHRWRAWGTALAQILASTGVSAPLGPGNPNHDAINARRKTFVLARHALSRYPGTSDLRGSRAVHLIVTPARICVGAPDLERHAQTLSFVEGLSDSHSLCTRLPLRNSWLAIAVLSGPRFATEVPPIATRSRSLRELSWRTRCSFAHGRLPLRTTTWPAGWALRSRMSSPSLARVEGLSRLNARAALSRAASPKYPLRPRQRASLDSAGLRGWLSGADLLVTPLAHFSPARHIVEWRAPPELLASQDGGGGLHRAVLKRAADELGVAMPTSPLFCALLAGEASATRCSKLLALACAARGLAVQPREQENPARPAP